ncbi:hypothetical protein Pelo_12428 [Pelomyxa schiedti]|nr:hypothetical protein Pelo_12428 [Pelomyxa schiedti]
MGAVCSPCGLHGHPPLAATEHTALRSRTQSYGAYWTSAEPIHVDPQQKLQLEALFDSSSSSPGPASASTATRRQGRPPSSLRMTAASPGETTGACAAPASAPSMAAGGAAAAAVPLIGEPLGHMAKVILEQVIDRQGGLRARVRETLGKYPPTGLYSGETFDDWVAFLVHAARVFGSDEGERGEVRKRVRDHMRANAAALEVPLAEIGASVGDNIADIAEAFEKLPRGKLWEEAERTRKNLAKEESFVKELTAENSAKKAQMIAGMTSKQGKRQKSNSSSASSSSDPPKPDMTPEQQIASILSKKEQIIEGLRHSLSQYERVLETDPQWLTWQKTYSALKPYLDQWNQVDTMAGHSCNTRGESLEQRCKRIAALLALKKLGLKEDRCTTVTNVRWVGCDGEADIILLVWPAPIRQPQHELPKVAAIIECKAHMFDIAAAFQQSCPQQRKAQKKNTIIIDIPPKTTATPPSKSIELPVDPEAPCFVLTIIPPHEFHLGFETLLREVIFGRSELRYKCIVIPPSIIAKHTKATHTLPSSPSTTTAAAATSSASTSPITITITSTTTSTCTSSTAASTPTQSSSTALAPLPPPRLVPPPPDPDVWLKEMQVLYNQLRERFATRMSPIEWLQSMGGEYLFVVELDPWGVTGY